jgi:DNA polymerase I
MALYNYDRVDLPQKPRMADFATWITACEKAILSEGQAPGTFLEVYLTNREEAIELVEEARELMRAYFCTYMGVNRWLRQAAPSARKQGYAVSLAGRKRYLSFEGLDEAESAGLDRVARNHPIQATNADILKVALTILYDVLPTVGAHTILAVHDEIVLECPIDQIEEATALLKEALVWACRSYLKVVHIPEPEVLVAPYWQKG